MSMNHLMKTNSLFHEIHMKDLEVILGYTFEKMNFFIGESSQFLRDFYFYLFDFAWELLSMFIPFPSL